MKTKIIAPKHIPARSPLALTLGYAYIWTSEHPWKEWFLGFLGLIVVGSWMNYWRTLYRETTHEPQWGDEVDK